MAVKINKIGIIGIGFVGKAIYNSLSQQKTINNIYRYDKYDQYDPIENILDCDIVFLSLPTVYDIEKCSYDLDPIHENMSYLNSKLFKGIIVNKSTVLPGTTEQLSSQYPNLNIVHNPEFLTARTASYDFHNQTHIVLGVTTNCNIDLFQALCTFYNTNYPNADISICTSTESECMKIFCNSFYSVKIQFFNELYLLSNKIGVSYDNIRDMMVKNGWINKMHTNVPGPDGLLSYGGLCFPKDTSALLSFMESNNTMSKVLEATINERNIMRNDNDNIKKK